MCMEWIHLTDEVQLSELIKKSHDTPQVIFKHSTRCSISAVALQRLRNSPLPEGMDFHYLDLLAHRSLSDKIADVFDVWHESPQVLVIKGGVCVFDESHLGISMKDIMAHGPGASVS